VSDVSDMSDNFKKIVKGFRLSSDTPVHVIFSKDFCRALIFANAETSQQYLLNLPQYKEYY